VWRCSSAYEKRYVIRLSIDGAVWFGAQTLAITFTLCMLLGALQRRRLLASTVLGLRCLTRSPGRRRRWPAGW
jgi:hypothetical protein